MRYPVEETAAKHERIVKEASRLFRERGFEYSRLVKLELLQESANPQSGFSATVIL